MVTLQTIQAHNATLKALPPSLVAVFVGGTSGISLSTARSLARHTTAPKIYLIGRSQPAADRAIAELKSINPAAQPTFLQADISLLHNVDRVCAEITARESRLNLLFMTPGHMTLKGRVETAEGLDRKLSLHYYARMRFVLRLMPLLAAAAAATAAPSSVSAPGSAGAGGLSRVVSVLDPQVAVRAGGAGKLDYNDLSLKDTFSLKKCGHHASLMGNFFLEGLATRYPHTSFVHAYPSGVATGLMREMPGGEGWWTSILLKVLAPFMVPLEESGERHLFAATSARYPPRGERRGEPGEVVVGSDEVKGGGSYWLNRDGEAFLPNRKMDGTREEGAVEKVWAHTQAVFRRICEEGRRYP
ncbi:uncharacterized protein BP01DRAFT_353957 [Aspergillus saccharolyticus JOP 1030-1]|uniref:Uncharacterized protein n=1 Tax=Aspergillus saccharolyticus JOP 1030-1 TaxID=1450539 RepID=A0A318ZNJ8_9EURO|nr:hypothetical protein BP01DRAFT_353957 [Aspergillus saccharolyticus JOP 1030-1]PYH48094.1 hypothetical protein BP01DRAFT_353957 [Aspergillus saccharolyticus JOP 1030-1]